MNFLIVNDDGYESPLLKALIKVVDRDFGYCYVSSPKAQRSATSHTITIENRLYYQEITPLPQTERTIVVDGFPADCVRIGLAHYEDIKFDYIISGINIGPNLSYDALYSGTLAAAKEGALYNIPSMAISTSSFVDDMTALEKSVKKAIKTVLDNKLLKEAKCLNLNLLPGANKVRFTSLGTEKEHPIFTKRDGGYYRVSYSRNKPKEDKDKDHIAYDNYEISITPILIDKTDYDILKKFRKKKI